mmetsp:Transcript_7518/g.7961  ORF Transcript_7518/g.7961 Transcript_7518/m.7961 type:complete len:305 (+) Transcript_7518:108-1022(+)
MNENNSKQNQINLIMRNVNISPKERQQMIQEILSGRNNSSSSVTSTSTISSSSSSTTTTTNIEQNITTEEVIIPPCTHYKKKCSNFYFSCCNIRDACHRCHKEIRGCQAPKITEIICNECNTAQSPASSCINCSISFSKSYCPICTIWTEKDIFHCNGCGLCRVGHREDYFHCSTCNGCFLLSSRSSHVCISRPMNEVDCPFCLESVHSSQNPGQILSCGHVVHTPCFHRSLSTGGYRCPSCRKSMIDMSSTWEEIRMSIFHQPMESNTNVHFLCFDCGHQGENLYHFLGIECSNCHSFNTVRS